MDLWFDLDGAAGILGLDKEKLQESAVSHGAEDGLVPVSSFLDVLKNYKNSGGMSTNENIDFERLS